jgi:putative transposase
MPARIEVIADWLKRDTLQAKSFRQQQLALMFDLSSFMKLLKQRFSIWFNQTHNRFGTLWAERFKSVLVDYDGDTLRTMAAYIDLNAVRKGLVADPKDYRFCGYAEALAGSRPARAGLRQITGESSWSRSQSQYRLLLYSTGAAPRAKGHTIDPAAFEAVIDADGTIPIPDLLRHKWRYFTTGTILGSPAFIAKHHPSLSSSASSDASRFFRLPRQHFRPLQRGLPGRQAREIRHRYPGNLPQRLPRQKRLMRGN